MTFNMSSSSAVLDRVKHLSCHGKLKLEGTIKVGMLSGNWIILELLHICQDQDHPERSLLGHRY